MFVRSQLVRRADICVEGNECVYKFKVHTAGHSSDDDGSNDQLERHMSHMEYIIKVSPSLNTKDNIKAWDVRAMQFSQGERPLHVTGCPLLFRASGGHDTGRAKQQHDHEFSRCSLQFFQDSVNGKVHAKVYAHDHEQSGCPSWAMQLVSDSVPSLVPVVSHAHNKQRFSHQENVSTPESLDERKVDVQVHEQGPVKRQVMATVHHHHFNRKAYKNAGMEENIVPDMKSDSLAQVVDNVITRLVQYNQLMLAIDTLFDWMGPELIPPVGLSPE